MDELTYEETQAIIRSAWSDPDRTDRTTVISQDEITGLVIDLNTLPTEHFWLKYL